MKSKRRKTLASSLVVPALLAATAMAAGCATAPEPGAYRAEIFERLEDEGIEPPEPEEDRPLEERTAPHSLAGQEATDEALAITRDGALLTAIVNNRALDVARFGPRLAETRIPEQRAAFDPNLMGAVSYGMNRQPLAGAQRFTFGRGVTNGLAPGPLGEFQQLFGPDPRSTTANMLNALSQRLARPPEPLFEIPDERELASLATGFLADQIEPEPDNFIQSRTRSGEIGLDTYLPTGTTMFLTGDIERSTSNFIPQEVVGRWTVGMRQALLRGRGMDVNLVALRQAEHGYLSSIYAFEQALLGLVAEVERAYWNLVLAQEVLAIREFAVELAEEQLQRTEDLLEVGRAVEGAVLSARAEKATREAELIEAKSDLRNQTIYLLQLLNPEDDPDWSLALNPQDPPAVEEVSPDPGESILLARAHRPELRQAELEQTQRELDVTAARNALLPELDLSAQYGLTSIGDTYSDGLRNLNQAEYYNYSVGLDFRMPLFNRAERARQSRAELASRQAARTVAEREQRVETTVHQALNTVQSRWDRIAATDLAVESREEELRVEEDRFTVGLVTHLDVLQVQRFLIQAQVDAITAKVTYIQALTNLYEEEGTLLTRRGISVETAAEQQ